MKRLYSLLVFALILSATASAQGNRIHVNINNPSPIQDGQSWETAFDNLAFAFFMAEAGDSLWIAAGTYYPTFGTNRTLSFLLKTGVQAYGGFMGNETSLEERDYENNITLLSGDIGLQGDSTDNTYHVVRAPAPNSSTVLDGLYIQHGNADGSDFDTRYGGGLFVSNPNEATMPARINILNCNFAHNSAKNGGAIGFNSDNSPGITPTIKNCKFTNNRAFSSGGALYRSDDNVNEDTITITSCLFQENRSATEGGAIDWSGLSQPMEFHNCVLISNSSISSGGGANFYSMGGSALLLFNSCIIENNEGNQGAGIFIDYISYEVADTSSIIIENSLFKHNVSNFSGGGGIAILATGAAYMKLIINGSEFVSNTSSERGAGILIQLTNSDINIVQTINNCIFINNESGSILGGAYRIRGAIGGTNQNYNAFTNCIFAQNTGAADITSGKPGISESLFLNCTFYENGAFNISKNWAPDFDYETYYNRIKVQNCIFQQLEVVNIRNHLLNGVIEGFDDNLYDYEISYSLVSAPDCDMPGGEMACGGNMQYSTLPSFIDPEGYDFHLSSCSPAIDAGQDSLVQELGITTDIGSNPRILDTDVDLGAYEQAAINIQLDSILAACPDGMNGAILFNTSGISPFEYELYQDSLAVSFVLDSLGAGSYSLFLTDSVGCMDTLLFSIPEVDSIQAEADIMPSSFPGDGSIEIIAVEGGTPPYQYLWSMGDTTAIITDLDFGLYTVTITDANGCSNSFSYFVDLTDGIKEVKEENFLLYPNPSQGNCWLDYQLDKQAVLTVYDILGRPILSRTLMAGKHQIPIHFVTLERGLYWLSVISDNRQLFVEKVILKD